MNGRLLYANKDKVLFESPPCTRLLNIGGTMGKTRKYLAFPYVQYYLRRTAANVHRYAHVSNEYFYGAFHVTISNKPMTNMEDIVHIIPLPHVFDDASFCMHPNLEGLKNLSDIFEKTVADFWASRFTYSTTFIGSKALEESIGNYKNWEELTQKDPKLILDVNWKYPMQLSKLPYRPYEITSHGNSYNV